MPDAQWVSTFGVGRVSQVREIPVDWARRTPLRGEARWRLHGRFLWVQFGATHSGALGMVPQMAQLWGVYWARPCPVGVAVARFEGGHPRQMSQKGKEHVCVCLCMSRSIKSSCVWSVVDGNLEIFSYFYFILFF